MSAYAPKLQIYDMRDDWTTWYDGHHQVPSSNKHRDEVTAVGHVCVWFLPECVISCLVAGLESAAKIF